MLESVREILIWDQRTFMPPNSADLRSKELVAITTAIHRNVTTHFLKNISLASKEDLTDVERLNLTGIAKKYSRIKKVKQSVITKLEEAKVVARSKWSDARENNNFQLV